MQKFELKIDFVPVHNVFVQMTPNAANENDFFRIGQVESRFSPGISATIDREFWMNSVEPASAFWRAFYACAAAVHVCIRISVERSYIFVGTLNYSSAKIFCL